MEITLPNWLRRKTADDELPLPPWAEVETHPHSTGGKVGICLRVSTDGYLKEWLELLEVEVIDQYWLEVCYQCAKLDLQRAIQDTEFDPRVMNKFAEFHFDDAPEYAQAKFSPGRGIHAATQGKEAREHYKRIRGRLPF